MEAAALAAARHIIEAALSKQRLEVNVKEDATLVLNLDIESQAIILEKLGGVLPVVAEEDPSSHRLIESAEDYLLVDPIDGTTSCKRFLSKRGGQVGFGPLLGYVQNGCLRLATFFNVPERTLYCAVRGEGCWLYRFDPARPGAAGLPDLEDRRSVKNSDFPRLLHSALLFYPGTRGEVRIVEHLRRNDLIENVYRFGGFANDCVRLARGFEQIQIQFAVKAWDLPAVLFPVMAGLQAVFDPLGQTSEMESWVVSSNNPVIIAPPRSMTELLAECAKLL